MTAATETGATFEFTINAGPGMRVYVDSYEEGVPFLIIVGGSIEVIVKPPDDKITPDAIAFADALVKGASAYAAELRGQA